MSNVCQLVAVSRLRQRVSTTADYSNVDSSIYLIIVLFDTQYLNH